MSNLREPSAPAVIAGSFADYRLIKSRSVLQLVIEIPVEAQAGAFDALGYPMPGVEIPVAVARLDTSGPLVVSPEVRGRVAYCGTAGLTPKARYAAMTAGEQAVQRAGRLPHDERFRAWVASEMSGPARTPDAEVEEHTAVWYIREKCCDGQSRKLIAEVPEYMDRFQKMLTEFMIAVGEIPEPR